MCSNQGVCRHLWLSMPLVPSRFLGSSGPIFGDARRHSLAMNREPDSGHTLAFDGSVSPQRCVTVQGLAPAGRTGGREEVGHASNRKAGEPKIRIRERGRACFPRLTRVGNVAVTQNRVLRRVPLIAYVLRTFREQATTISAAPSQNNWLGTSRKNTRPKPAAQSNAV